jgi:hypothetical protein
MKNLRNISFLAIAACGLAVAALTQVFIDDTARAVPTALAGIIVAVLSLKE